MLIRSTLFERLPAFAGAVTLAACSHIVPGAQPIEYRITASDGYSEFNCLRSGSSACHIAIGKPGGAQIAAHRVGAGETLRLDNPGNTLSYCVDPVNAPEWPSCEAGMRAGPLKTSTSINQWYVDSK